MTKPRKLSEYTIVQDLGESVCKRVKIEVIRTLDGMEGGLSGEDSGLNTLWEEICVQVQHEESIFWDMYDRTVRETIQYVVEKLPPFEREALWLLTDEGSDWECDDESDRDPYPICVSDIVRYIIENAVYEEARCSTNPNVLKYLRRKFDDDGEDEEMEEEGDADDEEEETGECAGEEDTPAKPCA
jgi:hypothetical protein